MPQTMSMMKYGIRNGRKYPIRSTSPIVKTWLTTAIPNVFGGQTDYMKWGASIDHQFEFNVIGDLFIGAGFQTFLYKNQLFFPDFIHFPGNQTFYSAGNDFRQLKYFPCKP